MVLEAANTITPEKRLEWQPTPGKSNRINHRQHPLAKEQKKAEFWIHLFKGRMEPYMVPGSRHRFPDLFPEALPNPKIRMKHLPSAPFVNYTPLIPQKCLEQFCPMNKSFLVNSICALLILIGHTLAPTTIKSQVLGMGYFGFSGAITNWLAIHMLFEKVPGLYGSGIIPLKFEAFKDAIRNLIMNQFFTIENIEKFVGESADLKSTLQPLVENINTDLLFDGFIDVVKASRFGAMLGMFGGAGALEPMREPFAEKLREKLVEMLESEDLSKVFNGNPKDQMHQDWQGKIGGMVDKRLAELTPAMVKDIIQQMIRSHLGWLVVWGGVFGGLIGFLSSWIM